MSRFGREFFKITSSSALPMYFEARDKGVFGTFINVLDQFLASYEIPQRMFSLQLEPYKVMQYRCNVDQNIDFEKNKRETE